MAFSILQIRPHQIRSAQFGTDQTIQSHAILSHASLCMYMLQQHMAVTCCQGSLSPGLASPALGQMAAHWALKSNCAAQDTRPTPSSYLGSSCLPGGLFSYSTSSHAKTPLCAGGLWFNWVSIQAEWKRQISINKCTYYHGFITQLWLQRFSKTNIKSNCIVPDCRA